MTVDNSRLNLLIWSLVAVVLLLGAYRLLNLHHRSPDQEILIRKSSH